LFFRWKLRAGLNGRAELIERDRAQELADVGQQPPIPVSDRTPGPAPF
jgi:hypothetical protein